MLFYDRPILDDLGKPGETCPVRGRFVKEVDIDMVVVLKFQEFWRGIVCDKNKVDLTLGVCWEIFVILISPKETNLSSRPTGVMARAWRQPLALEARVVSMPACAPLTTS